MHVKATMPDKTSEAVSWLLQLVPMGFAALLAALGGAVQYFNKIDRHGLPFSLTKFLVEICTSGFVGIVSFELCDSAGFSWQLTAAMVAISGHMGARALILIENNIVRRLENGYGEGRTGKEEKTCEQTTDEKES